MSQTNPELPHFYLSVQQVRESELLSPERFAELDEEIEKRLTKPRDAWGKVIESARLADLSPYGEWLYPRMAHEGDGWDYAKRQILCAILTEEERKMLDRDAFTASCAARERERFSKAKHVPEAEWTGGVFHGDTYYEDIEAFQDQWTSNNWEWDETTKTHITPTDAEYPEYLWAAKKLVVISHLDVADIVENQMCDRGWEEMQTDDLNGVPEFQAACYAFVEANADVIAHWEDNTIAIILEPRKS